MVGVAERKDRLDILKDTAGKLDEPLASIILIRYGLNGVKTGELVTFREIGELTGVSRERVRQREKKALSTLEDGLDKIGVRSTKDL